MDAARAVLKSDPRPKTALIGMIDTKDYESALGVILPCFERAVFLDGFAPNAVAAERLCGAGAQYCACEASHHPAEALVRAAALTDEGGLLFIGGSLYMAAELRALLVGRRL